MGTMGQIGLQPTVHHSERHKEIGLGAGTVTECKKKGRLQHNKAGVITNRSRW